MIDWQRVRLLRDEIGAEAFGEVVELFLEEVETEIDRLAGVDPGALDDLVAALHFLKGSALNLGFETLSQLCHDMEQAAGSGQAGRFDLTAISTCYQDSKAYFLRGLDEVMAA